MKNLIRIITFVFLLAFVRCSKKVTDPGTQPPNSKDSTVNTSNPCTANSQDILAMTIFPSDNSWNQDISVLSVDANSTQILSAYASAGVKADFGSGLWDNAPIGIPFVVVCGNQQKVPIVFRANAYDGNYGDESDPGLIPFH